MQLRGLILFLLAALFLPFNFALAESRHYDSSALAAEVIFKSQDGVFNLTVPAGSYSYLDVYLFELDNKAAPPDLQVKAPVYSYYLNSPEITDNQSFKINLALDKNNPQGKVVYYLNPEKLLWQRAPVVVQTEDEIIVELKGRSNQLVLADSLTVESEWQGQAVITASDNLLSIALPEFVQGKSGIVKIQPKAFLGQSFFKKRLSNIYQLELKADADQDLAKILSQAPASLVCPPYLKESLASAKKNNPSEVKKLQKFLKDIEEFSNVQVTGKYDKITIKAVVKFQERYFKEILQPLGLKSGTGQVYQATLKKINQFYCQDLAAKRSFIELSLKYSSSNNQAKTLYYWDEVQASWLPLVSFDDFENQTVIALTKSPALTFALFEEENQWVGEASWYAFKNGLFAASRDFPKGTRIKIINQSSGLNRGKSTIVTINDYGPELWTKRIIDLDKVAYDQIGNLAGGVMPVRIEVIE